MPDCDVFMSYRRSDSAGFARALYDKLRDVFGADRVFMDYEAIEPGEDFARVILERVTSARVLLALIGEDWLNASSDAGRRLDDPKDYVRREIATALACKLVVVPVLLEKASMPRQGDLPEELQPLARCNAVRLRNESFQADVDRVCRAIERVPPPPFRATWRTAAIWLAVTVPVLLASALSLLNVVGIDDWIERTIVRRIEPLLPRPSGRHVALVMASGEPGGNGSIAEPPGPPWRRHHALLIDALSRAGARVVVFDIDFDGPSEWNPALATAIADAEARGTAVVLAASAFDLTSGRPTPRLPAELRNASWGITEGAPSSRLMTLATRYVPPWAKTTPEPVVPSLSLATLARYKSGPGKPALRACLGPTGRTVDLRSPDGHVADSVPVADTRLNFFIHTPAGSPFLQAFPYHQLYESRERPAELDRFRDAIVVVGVEDERDLWRVESGGAGFYGAAFHAMTIAQLLERRYIRRPSPLEESAVVLGLAAMGFALRGHLGPLTRRQVRLVLPKPVDRPVFVPVALIVCVLVYLIAAFVVFRTRLVLPRVAYDLGALLLAFFAAGTGRRPRQAPAAGVSG